MLLTNSLLWGNSKEIHGHEQDINEHNNRPLKIVTLPVLEHVVDHYHREDDGPQMNVAENGVESHGVEEVDEDQQGESLTNIQNYALLKKCSQNNYLLKYE